MATYVVKNCMRQVENAYWVNGMYRNDQQCAYCYWWMDRDCQNIDHRLDCIVRKAKKIIEKALETE